MNGARGSAGDDEEQPAPDPGAATSIRALQIMEQMAVRFETMAIGWEDRFREMESGSDTSARGKGKSKGQRDQDEPPRYHDYRREIDKVVWPKYDGNYKHLRGYRKQIDIILARLTPGAKDYVVPFLLSYTTKDFQLHFDREEYKPEDFNGEGKLDEFFKVCNKLADVHPVDELYENMTFYMNTFKQKNEDDMKAYIAKEKIAWGGSKRPPPS